MSGGISDKRNGTDMKSPLTEPAGEMWHVNA